MERVRTLPKENRQTGTHNFRLFMLALLSLSMATFLLFHFTCIWLYGRLYISEPREWLLTLETVLVFSILGFSTYCVIEQMKGTK